MIFRVGRRVLHRKNGLLTIFRSVCGSSRPAPSCWRERRRQTSWAAATPRPLALKPQHSPSPMNNHPFSPPHRKTHVGCCVPCGCCSGRSGDLTRKGDYPHDTRKGDYPPTLAAVSLVAAAAASVVILPTSNPQGVDQWSRVAGRLPLLHHPQPPPPLGHTPLAGRSSRRPGGGGWGGTQASGSGDLLGQTEGVAHPLGAGRRPFGGNPKGVSEPRRLAARHVSFTGSKAAEAKGNGCQ